MEDKLEVGMYVRTKYGIAQITDIICGQDVKFDNDNIFENDDDKRHHMYDGVSKNDYFFKREMVGEPSFNIIDLIEEGDYVNGYRVTAPADLDLMFKEKFIQCDYYVECGEVRDFHYRFYESTIESIVTKEQFASVEYRTGE